MKLNVNFIKGINVDVEMLMQRCTNPETTGALKKLSETIKYSDPMTNSVVATQEQMIMQYMAELRTVFDSGDMDQSRQQGQCVLSSRAHHAIWETVPYL